MATLGTFVAGQVLTAAELNQFNNITVARCAALLNIADATATFVPLSVSIVDVSNWHSTTVNNTRITPNVTGLYRLHASIEWGSSAIDDTQSRWYVNGSATASVCRFVGTNIIAGHVNMFFVELTAGDYVELSISQTSGAGRPVNCQVSCELVRAA